MKTSLKVMVVAIATMLGSSLMSLRAQGIEFGTGVDIYSKYLWRGLTFGTGPQFQPTVNAKIGGLTVGVWGSFDAAGYTEADAYLSYATSFGLTATVTDYSTGTQYFKTDTAGDHAVEVGLAYTLGKLTIAGNYIINEAQLPGTKGGDTYGELSYAFPKCTIAVGGGNGWYTKDEKFDLCNISLKTTKELKFSDTYSLPVTGVIMLNPSTEMFSLAVGLTF